MRDINCWRSFNVLTQNHCDVEMEHQQSQGAEDGAQAVAGCSMSQLGQTQLLLDVLFDIELALLQNEYCFLKNFTENGMMLCLCYPTYPVSREAQKLHQS